MIDVVEAFKMTEKVYLEDDCYTGVREIRETVDYWLFSGKAKHTLYGYFDICIPKNGEKPFIYSNDKKMTEIWNNATVIKLDDIKRGH